MLRDSLAKQGAWLFRWRSFLPLMLVPIALLAVYQSRGAIGSLGEALDDAWEAISIGISLVGALVRILAVGFVPSGTSGRNTRSQRAERLNTTGMYSVVRHPLYLGNFLIFLGFVFFLEVWWLPLVAALAFAVYYERIMMTEEAFLLSQYGAVYSEWATRTPAFFPVLSKWKNPDMPFSWRTVLRREYGSVYLLCVYFVVVEFASDLVLRHEALASWMQNERFWLFAFGFGTLGYLSLRFLKKRTHLLDVPGR